MSGLHGTIEIQKVVFFGLQFGKDLMEASAAKGALGKAKAFADCQLLMDTLELSSIDLDKLEDEFMELDGDDVDDLEKAVRARFNLTMRKRELEEAIFEAFRAAVAFIRAIRAIVSAWPVEPAAEAAS
jgi:hypothetical protein